MTIDHALRQLHVALYDDFAALSNTDQSTIIITLEDLVDRLANSTDPNTTLEPPPCLQKIANPEKHSKPSG